MIFASQATFDAGGHAAGRFDQFVLGITLAGESVHNLSGTPLTLRRGDVQLVNSGTCQRWEAAGEWDTLFCIFDPRPHWRAWLRYPWREGYYVMSMGDTPAWRRIVQRMKEAVQWTQSAHAHRAEFQFNAIEEVLLWCHEHHLAQHDQRDERVVAALDYIASHLHEPLNVDDVSDAAGLSRSRLAALFGEQVGVAVMSYVEQQRMDRAQQLLRYTSESVAAIARDVGYDDAKYFSKRFNAATGMTPTAWRTS